MILIGSIGSDKSSTTTSSFQLGNVDEFALAVEDGGGSGFDSGAVTLQITHDDGTTWVDFTSGGSDVEFTAADRHKTVEFGGATLRFSAAAAVDDVDCYVAGPNVII